MRDLDAERYRMVYYILEILHSQVVSEYDYEDRRQREKEAKRQERRNG